MATSEKSEIQSIERNQKKRLLSISVVLILLLPLFSILTIIFYNQKPIDVIRSNISGVSVRDSVYESYSYTLDEDISPQINQLIRDGLDSVVYNDKSRFIYVEEDAQIEFVQGNENVQGEDSLELISTNMLLVTHPYSVIDDISLDDLSDWGFISVEEDEDRSRLILESYLGSNYEIEIVKSVDEMSTKLNESENVLGLIRSDRLVPTLKLCSIDREYFLDDPESGSLKLNISIASTQVPQFVTSIIPLHIEGIGEDAEKTYTDQIFSFRQTGVTALSRNLAVKMERSGDFAYPSRKIADFLSSADITHTSNEVSFVEGCVPEQSLRFCSAPEYIATLEESGIDVVELTGNHNNDFGAAYNATTIATYEEKGWMFFGGGRDATEASEIKYIEKDGSKIALLGYNWYDTALNTGAIASENRAGANSYSAQKLASDVKEAKENADFVIVDFQFQECYSYPESDVIYPPCYKALSNPDQSGVFRNAIDSGADLVVGSQAHQPQTYEIYKGKFIFYGLGNLFFDQILWTGTRQGLVITHYFIDGQHIQSKIDTTIYDSDMQPYVTYGDQRVLLLTLLDNARP